MRVSALLRLCLLSCAVAMLVLPAAPAHARNVKGFIASLSAADAEAFHAWLTARTFFNAETDAYWGKVAARKRLRRKKRGSRRPVTRKDYVLAYPPTFKGPNLPPHVAKAWAAHTSRGKTKKPRRRRADVNDYLRHAKQQYGFTPERVSERVFKQNYARHAMRLGLRKAHVVRIYAFETGGRGTADMQSGVNPITKEGDPISSALGYAQLLNANTISQIVRYGRTFIKELERLARAPGVSQQRAARLRKKIKALRAMRARARRVKDEWSHHRRLAGTATGKGMHAVNIDGDIGPMLQVRKLRTIVDFARKYNRTNLAPNEMELMNLAGPRTGIEMMTDAARDVPAVNFFSRSGYWANTVVRGRTVRELLAEIDKRMDFNARQDGAIEFAAVFDELTAASAPSAPRALAAGNRFNFVGAEQ